MEFKTTNTVGRGKKKHYHIIALDEESGIGFCSLDDKHKHKIQFYPAVQEIPENPGQPEQYDEAGNLIAEAIPPTPGQPGSPAVWVILPAEDGHTHEYSDVVLSPDRNVENESDETKLNDLKTLYKEALEIESQAKKNADKAEKFRHGEQWDEADKNYLEGLGRACITHNEVGRGINTWLGLYEENRSEISYRPQEGGDQVLADILNHLSKVILNNSSFHRHDLKAADSQATRGRGWFNMYVDFSRDFRGEVKVESFLDCDVFPGPHLEEDLSDCEYLFKAKMFSLGKLKQMYPKLSTKFDEMWNCYSLIPAIGEEAPSKDGGVEYPVNQYALSDNRMPTGLPMTMFGQVVVDVARKNFRFLECWRKVWVKNTIIAKTDGSFYFNAKDWSDTDLQKAENIFDDVGNQVFLFLEQSVSRIRITKACGNVIVSDEFPADLPRDDFYTVPVYATKNKDNYYGKVLPVIDSQTEYNKRRSQCIDIGNKMLAYGWFVDADTFENEGELNNFVNNSSSPGFVAKVANTSKLPVKIEGLKFPAEIVQLMQLDEQRIISLMGMELEDATPNETASHLLAKRQSKIVGNKYLLMNMESAKKKLGQLLVGMIQKYYPADRIYRILSNINSKEKINLGDKPFDDFTEMDIEELLSTADLELYDVEVIPQEPTGTARIANFLLMSELNQMGAGVTPDMLIELSDIPEKNKRKILEAFNMQQQAQQQAQTTAADVEVEKSLVAQGVVPPSVQERMQLSPEQVALVQQGVSPKGSEASPDISQTGGVPRDANVTVKKSKKKKIYKEIDENGNEAVVVEES